MFGLNPYVLLGAMLAIVGAFLYGSHVGANSEIAKQAKVIDLIDKARDAAQTGAANEIAKIKIVNRTIEQKATETLREIPVYQECKNTPEVKDLIIAARSGKVGAP